MLQFFTTFPLTTLHATWAGPMCSTLVASVATRAAYAAGFTTWEASTDDAEEFATFRVHAAEVIKECAKVLGGATLIQVLVKTLADSPAPPPWQAVEAIFWTATAAATTLVPASTSSDRSGGSGSGSAEQGAGAGAGAGDVAKGMRRPILQSIPLLHRWQRRQPPR